MKHFTSTARKDGRWWVVQCNEEPAALSQVARLDQAAEHQREAIAFVTDLDPDDIDVEVRVNLDDEIDRLLRNAEAHREQSDELAKQARVEFHHVAIELKNAGYSVRDIGAVLGVSHQRAHQLVSS